MSIEGKIGEKDLKRSTTVENVRQITPFYAKQTQFCAFFARKRRFHEKTKPKQTQLKPIQTQFKANLTQNKPNSNPIKANFGLLGSQFRNNSRSQRQKGWCTGKRRGQLRRDFAVRSKPHPSTIAGLIVPASGAWMLTSFNMPACNGTMTGFMPDRHLPYGPMPRARYDYFAWRVAAVVLPDKGAAGK